MIKPVEVVFHGIERSNAVEEHVRDEVAKLEPPYAIKLEKESGEKLQKMGVKLVDADKSGFIKAVKPIQDQLAKELGPHAIKMMEIIRSLK